MTKYWIALFVAVAANVFANVALKIGMREVDVSADWRTIPALIANPWLWVGGSLAGILLGSYLLAIKGIPLSIAYPVVTGLAMVGIAIASAWFLGESLGVSKLMGVCFVIFGVYLLSNGQAFKS